MEFPVLALGLARISSKLIVGRRIEFLGHSEPPELNRYQRDRPGQRSNRRGTPGQSAAPAAAHLAKPASAVYQEQFLSDTPAEPVLEPDFSI